MYTIVLLSILSCFYVILNVCITGYRLNLGLKIGIGTDLIYVMIQHTKLFVLYLMFHFIFYIMRVNK